MNISFRIRMKEEKGYINHFDHCINIDRDHYIDHDHDH